jgi:hypothetical protein
VRGFSDFALLYPPLLFVVSFLILQGCGRPLLQTYPVDGQETQLAITSFARYQKIYQERCVCCLDAEVDVSASISAGWFTNHSGKISGYLQALEPGYIKFVSLNPLGQPIFIFLTDGKIFKALNVLEGKAFVGSVHAETFKKFAPPGFDPEFSYYWLTGGLPPGDIDVLKVRRDKVQDGYWLHVRYEKSDIESFILFDPHELVVKRHIFISEKGHDEVDVVYEDYQHGFVKKQIEEDRTDNIGSVGLNQSFCKMPTKISIISNSGSDKKLDLKLFSFMPDVEFSKKDFELDIPANLEKLIVN